MIKSLIDNNYLIRQLIKKDIEQRYKGSVLGIFWSFLIPILMLIIYTFVFSEVFQAKWGSGSTDNKFEFALILFCGLSAFNMVSEVMNRSTVLIASNVNYVKKVIFPLEALPVIITFSSLFNCLISYLILIVAKLFLEGNISKTLYQIIFLFIPLILLCVGLSLFISAISVYLKDVGNAIGVIVTILMYMSPVFFPLASVPERFQIICMINPMTYIIENFRKVTLYGENIDIMFYLISLIVALLFCVFGKVVFYRAKEGFADVL